MRIELVAIKAALEVAMSNEIDEDEAVPPAVIDGIAALHTALEQHEKE